MIGMAGQVWVSLISVGGVVLGGVLSYLVQHRTQQSAERAEQQRRRIALSETRRAERLALLERFIEVSAEADRLLRIQFPLPVHDAAHAPFLDLNRTVWHGLPDGESVRDHLEDNRSVFLDAAREVMG
ncbi:hypothetical protein [Streptomyces sp. NPDC001980]|uniref:hypothetical protein n=1 Tax=Streptomyces sp. NPDC001980 TaxID=3157126 RepID=UPI00331AF5C8